MGTCSEGLSFTHICTHSLTTLYSPFTLSPVLQGVTYKGALTLDLCWGVEGLPGTVQKMQKRVGSMPIMVKSTGCHLQGETVTALRCINTCAHI